ncbi:hypothetical protein [Herbaspirillum huttiense]|uniref:Uncharacterized protein n=2 Tax=Herbaspirillum huttiense TaxID=863372 RepID=A0AAJ2HCD2_9BURK|nr:hypothetical protein [Herbaspirillum huttiense]MDR9839468.1 hypothetical protein [Herbaspirillum huttiense]
MQLSNIPAKIAAIFAASAPTGYKNTIPLTQAGIALPGQASYDVGFPSVTMQPAASGGINPYGQDFNGLGFALSGPLQWVCAGGTFPFDSAFASTIGGYPKGAVLQNATGDGFWLNLADNNSANPDTGGANWAPMNGYGITTVSGLTNANVTLTAAQYSKPVIILSGTLTGNVQIIFPTLYQQWTVVNNTSGAFTVTCKTSSGTGAAVTQGGQQIFYGDGFNLMPVQVAQSLPIGQCRLSKSGSNLVLSPFNGNKLTISGVQQTIPAAGVSLAPTGLTAGTLYFVYAYMNAGVMTLEPSATGHATDSTTGVEIKSGDPTRTLVGMARPITGPAWQDTAAQRFVRSWFNDPGFIATAVFTAARTTSSTTPIELNSEIRNEFLSWSGEIFRFVFQGVTTLNGVAGQVGLANIGIDSTSTNITVSAQYQRDTNSNIGTTNVEAITNTLSEGYHYATMLGYVSNSSGTWAAQNVLSTTTGGK